jgi:hypothetical protein
MTSDSLAFSFRRASIASCGKRSYHQNRYGKTLTVKHVDDFGGENANMLECFSLKVMPKSTMDSWITVLVVLMCL